MYEVPDEIPSGLQCATTARIAARGLLRADGSERLAARGARGSMWRAGRWLRLQWLAARLAVPRAARGAHVAVRGLRRAACGARRAEQHAAS